MELDKVLKFAVIKAWEDLVKASAPRSIRVEYRSEPGTPLDCLSVWSTRAGGEQDLVCDYWTWTSPAHLSGVRFTNGYHSDGLGQTLDFILKNQDQFTRPADACRDGLILIDPPSESERTEAATWRGEAHGTATGSGSSADVRVPLS